MKKIPNNFWKYAFATALLVCGVFSYFCFSHYAQPIKPVTMTQVGAEPPSEELIRKKCSCTKVDAWEDGNYVGCSNARYRACVRDVLGSLVVEREWKYEKLLNIQHPQINQYDFTRTFDSYRGDITKWHKNLNDNRDGWCDAEYSAESNNGVDTLKDTCKVTFELRAIEVLDHIYYQSIMTDIYNSQGFKDFEEKTLSK